jgi:hypothetical protein
MSAQKQVMDWIVIQWTQLVSEQACDEVDVMRLLEPLTVEIIVRLGDSENPGGFRIEWIIAGCWMSRHDTIVEHDGSRRTDVTWAYIVRGQNYRLRTSQVRCGSSGLTAYSESTSRVSCYIGPDPWWACMQNNNMMFSPNLIDVSV